jgi:hypothetical protein
MLVPNPESRGTVDSLTIGPSLKRGDGSRLMYITLTSI